MKVKFLSLVLLSTLISVSCRHRDLPDWELPDAAHCDLKVTYNLQWEIPEPGCTDWRMNWPQDLPFSYDDLLPAIPHGLRVHKLAASGKIDFSNLPPDGQMLEFDALGMHSLIFRNNDSETIRFSGMDDPGMAYAFTQGANMGAGHRQTPDSMNYILQPDNLFAHVERSYEVLHPLEGMSRPLSVVMQPRAFTYLIVAEFSAGREFITAARGTISGLSSGVWLATGERSDLKGIHSYTGALYDRGVYATVRSFGTPQYARQRSSNSENKLILQLSLTHGNIVQREFDVRDQIAAQPRGGVIIVKNVAVSPQEAEIEGEGFSVTVNDWGEPIIIDVK